MVEWFVGMAALWFVVVGTRNIYSARRSLVKSPQASSSAGEARAEDLKDAIEDVLKAGAAIKLGQLNRIEGSAVNKSVVSLNSREFAEVKGWIVQSAWVPQPVDEAETASQSIFERLSVGAEHQNQAIEEFDELIKSFHPSARHRRPTALQ